MERRELATRIVRRLREAGHEAYFAGGCVRDRLLGREPLDFDVATSAPPEAVQAWIARRLPRLFMIQFIIEARTETARAW